MRGSFGKKVIKASRLLIGLIKRILPEGLIPWGAFLCAKNFIIRKRTMHLHTPPYDNTI